MKKSMLLAASLTAAFLGVLTSVPAAEDAVYTAEQAKRGEEIYMDWGRCYMCHLRNLEGDPKRQAPPLVGERFMREWGTKPLSELHYKIRWTMPAFGYDAGTLLEDQVSDIVAFLLQKNGVAPGGRELPDTEAALKQVTIKK